MDKYGKSPLEVSILNDRYAKLPELVDLSQPGRLELDLGCGKGGFSIAVAKAFPETVMLAADVMLGRLRKVQGRASREGLANLRLLRVEARHLVSIMMDDSSLDRLHILCPDPWPKDKHRSHRLLTSDFMAQIFRVLKPGGIFHFATDDRNYMDSVKSVVAMSGLFDEAGQGAIADVLPFKTEFERDWLAMGREVPHVAWRVKKAIPS